MWQRPEKKPKFDYLHRKPLREIPGGNFVITLHVRGKQKARALATLLVRTKQIGNLRILVRVKTTEGNVVQPISRTLSPREIANLYRVAFRTNGVAAFVFRDVLRNTINRTPILLLSTARKKTGSTNYRK